MSKLNIAWYDVSGDDVADMEQWLRLRGVRDDGRVYLPAAIFDHPFLIMLCAGWDDSDVVVLEDHAYVDTEWLKGEFPDALESIEKIETESREWYARDPLNA